MTNKKLSKEAFDNISEFSREFPQLSPIILEKDEFVTDVISSIASIENPDFFIVFCGGACLSKSYKILKRMSEDIDFKIVLREGVEMSKSQRGKKLSLLMNDVVQILVKSGWAATEEILREGKRSRDGNTYTNFDLLYTSSFQGSSIVRPYVKLEFNFTELQSSPSVSVVNKMTADLLAFQENSHGALPLEAKGVQVKCISLPEALAEKLISFPRRLMKQLEKYPELSPGEALIDEKGWDVALVRHLYDVYEILKKTDTNLISQDIITGVIEKDKNDFKNQDPQFSLDPLGQLQKALDLAARGEVSNVLKKQYIQFIGDMVYGENPPSYDDALGVFSNALSASGVLNNSPPPKITPKK